MPSRTRSPKRKLSIAPAHAAHSPAEPLIEAGVA